MDQDIEQLDRESLAAEVRRLRAGIRRHRDSSGQELCWHHPQLWGLLPEKSDPVPVVPAWPQFLRGCMQYRESLDRDLPHARRSEEEYATTDGPDEALATLDFEMTYRFRIRGPLAPTDGSPQDVRQYWEMTEGTLTGERINATIAMPGGDWYTAGADGFGRPDVRVQFATDDGAVVLLHYTGLVQQTAAFLAASQSGGETSWKDHYMRMAMTFHTVSPKYAWLNESLFIATCRLAGRNELHYRIYRVN